MFLVSYSQLRGKQLRKMIQSQFKSHLLQWLNRHKRNTYQDDFLCEIEENTERHLREGMANYRSVDIINCYRAIYM